MIDNKERIRFIWDLIEEATERRDVLVEGADLGQDRMAWIREVRPRLLQEFGEGDEVLRFNNPDSSASLAKYADSRRALEAARAAYDTDIEYFRAIRPTAKAR